MSVRIRLLAAILGTALVLMAVPRASKAVHGLLTNTFAGEGDLSVSKTGPDTAAADSDVTFTINVVNGGPDEAGTATLTDPIPAGLTFVSLNATTGAGIFSPCSTPSVGSGGTITCTATPFATGAVVSFTLVLHVPAAILPGTSFTNIATIASSDFDPNEENNSGSAGFIISGAPSADMLATKSAPANALPDSDVPFDIVITNAGPNSASNVSFSDALPGDMTFVSMTQTSGPVFICTTPGPPVTCTIATFNSGATASFTLEGHIPAGSSATYANQVTVSSTTSDPNTENNIGQATVKASSADVSVTKSGPPTAVAGNSITWLLTLTNGASGDTAINPTFVDELPSGTTFVSLTHVAGTPPSSCITPLSGANGTVTCTVGSLGPGVNSQYSLIANIASNVPVGSVINNTVTASSENADPNPTNNSSTFPTTVDTSANLSVTKVDSPDPVTAGNNITYTINFMNNGPSDAQTVTVTDAVPANTTFVSAAIATGTGWTIPSPPAVGSMGDVVFSKGTVAASETASFTVVVKVNANTPAATLITNNVVAASATTDPTSGNDTGTATTTVATSADLSVAKSDSPDPVTVGSNLTYTITVTNNGPSDAQNLSLEDTVPVNTTFVSFTVPGGWTRTDGVIVGGTGTVTATALSLAAGANAVFTLVVNVNLGTPHNTVLTNSATVASPTDSTPGNNTGSTTTTVNSTLALTVNDSGDAADNNVGDRICDTSAAAGDQCTLRAAIQETNAAVTADTIDFSLPANTTITLLSALDDINGGDLVMTGPASGVTVNGGGAVRVLNITSGNVNISNLTISGGQVTGGGGGLLNNSAGTVTLTNMTFTGNTADFGGGIRRSAAVGTMNIYNTTISGNTALQGGGGLSASLGGTVNVLNSTIYNNNAGLANGGGISAAGPTVNIKNSIVAGNTGASNVAGTTDQGNNILSGDPKLAPLADNGGPTRTHAPLAGSPALDMGDNTAATNAGLSTDQRGGLFGRIRDAADADTTQTVDIGAFEADPSVEDISDKSTSEDTALPPFIFNVGDSSTAFTSIVATSNNQTLVPDANIVVGPNTASTRTLSITPAANQFGTATITVTVTKSGQSMSDTFILTVNGVNDPPSFTKGADQTVAEDSGAQSVSGWATNLSQGPGNESGQTLTFVVQNNTNPGLFSAGPAISSTGTLTYTPAANANGSATITIVLMDNGGGSDTSGPQSFVITVTEVNDAPDAVDDALTSVAEDSGQRTIAIASLLANDTRGPANESGQTLTLTGVSNPVGGTVSSDATNVYFTPTADFSGPASFQYTVTDNGTTNGVADPKTDTGTASFAVTEVNAAPVAVNDELADVVEDSGPWTIPFAALTANDSTGPANESGQTLVVKTVSNAVGGQVSIVGSNVIFTPRADYFGGASFDYTIEDNGTTNGAADPRTSGPATARFTVTEVNDAPTAVNDTLSSVAEDSGERTILASALTGNDLVGPANEVGQTLVVKTVSNAVGGTVSIVGGNVHFTPTADFNGLASFQYTVEDNGTSSGVANPKTSGPATASFNIGAVADTPSVTNATTNANTQTTSGLVISRNPADGAEVTHFKITGITGGTLFKNDGVTPINNGDFITFAEGNAGLKFTPGTSNGSFQVQSSTNALDAGLQGGIATATITVNPGGGVIRFSSGTYSVAEGAGFITITVERTGDTSQAVTVDYASSDHSNPPDFIPCTSPGAGFASSRCDFTTAIGRLRFAAGETSKTFNVLISDDNYVEGPESLNLTLSNPTGGAVFGVPSTAILNIIDDVSEPATNPIDNAADFVRAQYHDILGREPDAAGLAFWTDNIEKCNDPARRPAGQTAAVCIDKQRESTAIAFFMSPEFQMTGGFAYHLYKGSLTGTPNYDGGSAGRFPTFLEFMSDMSQVSEGIVVNGQISGAVVEANRNRLAAEFVQRPEFVAKYGGLDNTLYVQELFNTTGIAATAAEKQALVDGLTGGTETRASVLRKVVDGTVVISEGNVQFTTTYGQAFINQENRRLFVYLEYIGYLRRDPDAAGFVFWLGKLNFFNGDPFQAEMVRAFILSPEYRSRFGQ